MVRNQALRWSVPSVVLVGGAVVALAGGWGGDALEATTPAVETAAASYAVDPVHSSIVFCIKHAGVTNFYGTFDEISGDITFDPVAPESSSFTFEVPVSSIDAHNADRDKHLLSPDFFNAREFPTASFASTSVKKKSGNTYSLTGDFTVHGVTRSVTADLEFLGEGSFRGNALAAFEIKLEFKRSDFGMTTFLAPDGGDGGGVGNTVKLVVSVEAPKQ